MAFVRRVWRSVAEPASLREILLQPAGRSLVYLVLLVTVTFAVSAARNLVAFSQAYSACRHLLTHHLPEFSLRDGILRVEGPQPYVYAMDETSPTTMVIVDSTISPEFEDLEGYGLHRYEAFLFLGRDRAWTNYRGTPEALRYADLGLEFDKQLLVRLMPYAWPLAAVFGLAVWVFALAGKVISTAFAACLVSLLARAGRKTPPFFVAWNLAAHAVTAPVLLDFVRSQLGLGLHGTARFVLYYGITLVYAHLALARTEETVAVPPEDRQTAVL